MQGQKRERDGMINETAFFIGSSFALTIILFLAFSACLDLVSKLLPSESNFSPDIAVLSQENTNSIEEALRHKSLEYRA